MDTLDHAPSDHQDHADLVAAIVPGPSFGRQLGVVAVVIALAFALAVVPSSSFQASFNDWRHTGELEGELALVDGPLNLRSRPATVAIDGGRVLIWGGQFVTADSGAIYDPADGSWEHLPPAPGNGRFDAAVAWTGDEVVIWGGSTSLTSPFDFDPGGLAYDPAERTWRELPPAPFGLLGARAVAFDDGVLIAGGSEQTHPADVRSLWLDLETGGWTAIPAPVAVVNTAWDGDRLLATGPPAIEMGRQGSGGWPVVTFDPVALAWHRVAAPLETEWMALAVDDAGTLSAVTLDGLNEPLRAHEWDGGAWEQVAETERGAGAVVTIEIVSYPPAALWTGEMLLVGGEGGLTGWDPANRRFATTSGRFHSFGGGVVWTGSAVVALSNQSNEGRVWTPSH